MRRPRRIFRSQSSGPARGVRGPLIAVAAVAFGFLALAALVMAGAVFPSASRGLRSGTGNPVADRVEAAAADTAVVDGSTLRLLTLVIRLEGIETPARGRP